MASDVIRTEVFRNWSQFGDEFFPTIRVDFFREGVAEPEHIIKTMHDFGPRSTSAEARADAERIKITKVNSNGTFDFEITV